MEQVSIKTKILVLLTVPFNMYRILTLYIVKVMKLKIRTQCRYFHFSDSSKNVHSNFTTKKPPKKQKKKISESHSRREN